jgi:hypothetical protein
LLPFQPDSYGSEVARILALGDAGGGTRPMELFPRGCADEAARSQLASAPADQLFRAARDPHAALAGLYLYFSCLNEAHEIAQSLDNREGSFWHAMMHRMEGDIGNSRYWFHRVPSHPVYPLLQREAEVLGYRTPGRWDPSGFAGFCESAPDTKNEDLAKRVQLAEWQLLFDYCAAPVSTARDGVAPV